MIINNTEIEALLNSSLGGDAYTPIATWEIGLVTDEPLDDGTGFTEVTGGAYARVTKTNNNTNFGDCTPGSREKTNGTVITFPTPTLNWGACVGCIFCDAAAPTIARYYAPFPSPETINTGNVFSLPVGQLKIRAL